MPSKHVAEAEERVVVVEDEVTVLRSSEGEVAVLGVESKIRCDLKRIILMHEAEAEVDTFRGAVLVLDEGVGAESTRGELAWKRADARRLAV